MSQHIVGIDKIAERNMQKWVLAEHVKERVEKRNVADNVGPFVAISREIGTHGSEIARLVGDRLGYEVLDREIIDYMVEHYGTPRDLVEFVDEHRASVIGDVFRSWIEGQRFTEAAYAHRLIQLFLLAAQHGRVVIVGRGSQFVLPRDCGINVRIIAPQEFRIKQVALQRSLNEHDARKFVEDSDRQRVEFVERHFHHQASDPHVYDLVINAEKLMPNDVADTIVTTVKSWTQRFRF